MNTFNIGNQTVEIYDTQPVNDPMNEVNVRDIRFTRRDFSKVVKMPIGAVNKRFSHLTLHTTVGDLITKSDEIKSLDLETQKYNWVQNLRAVLKPTDDELENIYDRRFDTEEYTDWVTHAYCWILINSIVFDTSLPFLNLSELLPSLTLNNFNQ